MRTVFEIEEFHRLEDGDDFYPAMWRAQQVGQLPSDSIDPQGRIGWTILFRPKVYRFSRPIELVRCMHLQGSGGSDAPGTRFVFVNDTPGLIVHRAATPATITLPDFLDETEWQPKANIPPRLLPVENESDAQASGILIESIQIKGSFQLPAQRETYVNGESFLPGETSYALYFDRDETRVSQENERHLHGLLLNPFETMSKPDRRCHGIIAYARFTLKNSVVENFSGHGIYIYGDSSVSNADGWKIDTVITQKNGNNGLHVVGENASPGVAINLYANENRFWGIADLSRCQATNQYISGQTSYNHYGGFLRPRAVRFINDPHPEIANGDGFPLNGPVLLRGVYGENGASVSLADGTLGPTYAGKTLQFNRFIWQGNILEHCVLNNVFYDSVNNQEDGLATGIDTGYRDTHCNTINLEGERIPSFNTGIFLQDRLSLMAYGSTNKKVWIRAVATTEAEIDRLQDADAPDIVEIVFFTDPVAGGYIGSVRCIIEKDDGTKEWGYRKFGKIEL
jgi:hypothetical protein